MRRALLALLLLWPALSKAEVVYDEAAKVSLPQLALPTGPRQIALGEAGVGLAGELYDLRSNPAGLATLPKGMEFSLARQSFLGPIPDLSQQMMGMGFGTGSFGMGLDIAVMDLGALETRSSSGRLISISSASAFSMSAGLAGSLLDRRLEIGLAGAWGDETLSFYSIDQFTGSAGLSWRPSELWRYSAALRHLGAADKGALLPTELSLGGTFQGVSSPVMVSLEALMPQAGDLMLRAGLEWTPFDSIALRGGYRQQLSGSSPSWRQGPTGGFALKVKDMSFEYAYASFGPFGSHNLALNLRLPDNLFKRPASIVIQADGGTATAKVLMEAGEKLLKEGHNVDALVAFKQSLQNDPDNAEAAKRIETITAALSGQAAGKGLGKEAETMRVRYVEEGKRQLKLGDYRKAIAALEIALEVDKQNQDSLAWLKQAREASDSAIAELMAKAKPAIQKGDLLTGVPLLQQALKMDPDQADAKALLATHRVKILAEIERWHRKGIDQYVEGNLDDAMESWRKALSLDPADPLRSVRRDIEKAQKLKALRQGP